MTTSDDRHTFDMPGVKIERLVCVVRINDGTCREVIMTREQELLLLAVLPGCTGGKITLYVDPLPMTIKDKN